jgi:hypothetical protein
MTQRDTDREKSAAPRQPSPDNAVTQPATTGDRLKRGAAGQGFDAQEALLSPDAGVLSPARVEGALRYNRKASGSPALVRAIQGFFGVEQSGAWDVATVHGVASFQGDRPLQVDGMVGPNTKKALTSEGVVPVAPARNPQPKQEAVIPAVEATPRDAGKPESAEAAPTDVTQVGPEAAPAAETEQSLASEREGKPSAVDAPEPTLLLGASAPPMGFGQGTTLTITAFIAWAEGHASDTDRGLAAIASMDPTSADARALRANLGAGAGPLKEACAALRTRAVKLVNDASLLKRPDVQPTLPDRAELQTLSAALRRIGKVGGAMAEATAVGLDAILAIQQGASVLSARATWAEKPREGSGASEIEAQKKAKDDPLNAIFKDSGFANRVTSHKNSEGVDKISDWCGMFVGASLFRGGGLDEELRAGMLHTSNVLDYFQYTQVANAGRVPKSIWADGEWHDLKTYHATRGSTRTWQSRGAVTAVMEGGGALDVRPGDVVLIDHKGNKPSPQHITMVESYDPATHQLVTIEGNTGGIRAGADGKVGDAGDGHHKTNATGRDGSGLHTRDMTNMSAKSRETHAEAHAANMARHASTPKGAYRGTKGATVFGIGRPSAVDFEEHQYATRAVPEELRRLSPSEMEAKAKAKVGVHASK